MKKRNLFFTHFILYCSTLVYAAVAGEMQYNSTTSQFEYYNGSAWVSMKSTANGSCSAAEVGSLKYASGYMQFCDGSNWYRTGAVTSLGSCSGSTVGEMRYASSKMQWCNGTNWIDMTGAGLNYFGTGADGNLNTAGVTNVCDSTTDGSMCVMNYATLTINSGHQLTTTVRRKGLLVYVQGNAVINGTLSMTARGAAVDPVAAGVPAGGLKIARYTAAGSNVGSSDLSGTGSSSESGQNSVTQGVAWTFARAGAAGGAASDLSGTNGSAGQAGGGGAGADAVQGSSGGLGAAGTVFSGGAGGGGAGTHLYSNVGDGLCEPLNSAAGTAGSANGGAGGNAGTSSRMGALCNTSSTCSGGGAGNGGGSGTMVGGNCTANSGASGTGGLLILIVGGNLTIGSGASIEAKGSAGGLGVYWESHGGGSGGGNILILYAGNLSNAGAISSAGGGNGGSGSVQGPTQISP
ncbi:MAG: hypothetical protein V4654_14295 [Bdellovibrionota bacterium]